MAVISHHNKWMFIHVAKNGGTSVVNFLHPFLAEGDLFINGNSDKRTNAPQDAPTMHSPAYDYIRYLRQNGYDWDEYTTFAIIRDPFERVQSAFHELRWGFYNNPKGPPLRGMFDDEWGLSYQECIEDINEFIARGLMQKPSPPTLFAPQWMHMAGLDGEIAVEHVILLEDMPTKVPSILGLGGTIGHINKTPLDKKALSAESLRLIRDRYIGDFKLIDELNNKP